MKKSFTALLAASLMLAGCASSAGSLQTLLERLLLVLLQVCKVQ